MPPYDGNLLAQQLRREMPLADRWAFFDHAAVAPISAPARDAITHWAAESASQGNTVWPSWSRRKEAIRTATADLITANAAEIAFVRNTTHGISVVAEGFAWQPGDNVVTLENEFPSNQYPWLNLASRGVEVRRVPVPEGRVDLTAVEHACDARTRIVSLSWVGFASGFRFDLVDATERVHRRGALLFVDAIQGLGAFPLDVSRVPIDFLAADGHKWLLGPEGLGILYVRHEHLNRLRPLEVGWHSVVHDHDFTHIELTLKQTAARFEGGSANIPGILGFGASVDLLAKLGPAAIGQRILEATNEACDRLRSIGATIFSDRSPSHASGIVSFELPGRDPNQVRRHCLEANVALSCRAGRLRISPHAYCNDDDLRQLIQALAAAPA